jgi:hypothetical protein
MALPANPTLNTIADGMICVGVNPSRWIKYTAALAIASATVLGGVMQGSGPVSINPTTGALSVDALSTATATSQIAAAAAVGTAAGVAAANAQTAANSKFASATRVGNDLVFKDASGATVNTLALGDLGVDIAADNLSIDGNFVMTFQQTNGGGTKTVDLRTLKSINASMSVTGDGDATPIKLAGDVATPGNRMAYSTAEDGTKGWGLRIPKTWTVTPDATATIEDKWVEGGITYFPSPNGSGGLDWLGQGA